VCIKRGEYGAMLFLPREGGGRDEEQIFTLPSMPLAEVRDPTGAGDSFAGGFLGSLAAGGRVEAQALRRSAVLGTVLASFTVERFGLERLGSLTPAEVEARFQIFSRLTWQGHA
jgi:sugar/nucleoside kinase (ribokinase family)